MKEAPELIVFAGPNGSGKSTLVRELLENGVDIGAHINPDEIAASLEGSYESRVREAQSIADARRAAFIERLESFSFETVMSHPSKLEVMRQAKAAGFHVTLFFVCVREPAINVHRVHQRVRHGGHDVPADRIIARYYRTMALVGEATLIADGAVIFDNSSIDPDPASWLRPVLEVRRKRDLVILRDKNCPSWLRPSLLGRIHEQARQLGLVVKRERA